MIIIVRLLCTSREAEPEEDTLSFHKEELDVYDETEFNGFGMVHGDVPRGCKPNTDGFRPRAVRHTDVVLQVYTPS